MPGWKLSAQSADDKPIWSETHTKKQYSVPVVAGILSEVYLADVVEKSRHENIICM